MKYLLSQMMGFKLFSAVIQVASFVFLFPARESMDASGADRPAPQALTRALAAARIVPQSICGLCGGPRMQPRQREAIRASKLTERFVRAFC